LECSSGCEDALGFASGAVDCSRPAALAHVDEDCIHAGPRLWQVKVQSAHGFPITLVTKLLQGFLDLLAARRGILVHTALVLQVGHALQDEAAWALEER